ncbi:16817_t:CDS:1, partial [Funneliformis caledonium]
GAPASALSKQFEDALKLLHLAPNQAQDFPRAFERCAEWVYRRN